MKCDECMFSSVLNAFLPIHVIQALKISKKASIKHTRASAKSGGKQANGSMAYEMHAVTRVFSLVYLNSLVLVARSWLTGWLAMFSIFKCCCVVLCCSWEVEEKCWLLFVTGG